MTTTTYALLPPPRACVCNTHFRTIHIGINNSPIVVPGSNLVSTGVTVEAVEQPNVNGSTSGGSDSARTTIIVAVTCVAVALVAVIAVVLVVQRRRERARSAAGADTFVPGAGFSA